MFHMHLCVKCALFIFVPLWVCMRWLCRCFCIYKCVRYRLKIGTELVKVSHTHRYWYSNIHNVCNSFTVLVFCVCRTILFSFSFSKFSLGTKFNGISASLSAYLNTEAMAWKTIITWHSLSLFISLKEKGLFFTHI